MRKKYRFLNDYEVDYKPDGKTYLKYIGPYTQIDMDMPSFQRVKKIMLLLALVQFVLFFAIGMAGTTTTRVIYIGLPYALLIVPALYLIYAAARFYKYDLLLERRQYERDFLNMAGFSIVALILSGICVVGGIVWFFIGPRQIVNEYLFAPLSLLYWFCVYVFFAYWRLLEKKISKND